MWVSIGTYGVSIVIGEARNPNAVLRSTSVIHFVFLEWHSSTSVALALSSVLVVTPSGSQSLLHHHCSEVQPQSSHLLWPSCSAIWSLNFLPAHFWRIPKREVLQVYQCFLYHSTLHIQYFLEKAPLSWQFHSCLLQWLARFVQHPIYRYHSVIYPSGASHFIFLYRTYPACYA